MIALTMPGTDIDLKVIRKGKEKVLSVKLGRASEAETSEVSHQEIVEKLGFTVQDLSEELAKQFGYKNLDAVLVSKVKAGSPAAFVGLRPGMLILEVNQKSVKSVAEFFKAMEDSDEIKKVLLLISDGQTAHYIGLPLE